MIITLSVCCYLTSAIKRKRCKTSGKIKKHYHWTLSSLNTAAAAAAAVFAIKIKYAGVVYSGFFTRWNHILICGSAEVIRAFISSPSPRHEALISDLRQTLASHSTQRRSNLLTHTGSRGWGGLHRGPFWLLSTGCLLDKESTRDIEGTVAPSDSSDLWTPSETDCSWRSRLEKWYESESSFRRGSILRGLWAFT